MFGRWYQWVRARRHELEVRIHRNRDDPSFRPFLDMTAAQRAGSKEWATTRSVLACTLMHAMSVTVTPHLCELVDVYVNEYVTDLAVDPDEVDTQIAKVEKNMKSALIQAGFVLPNEGIDLAEAAEIFGVDDNGNAVQEDADDVDNVVDLEDDDGAERPQEVIVYID